MLDLQKARVAVRPTPPWAAARVPLTTEMPMRATTRTRTRDTSWMDKENDWDAHYRRTISERVSVAPGLYLKRLRDSLNKPALDHRPKVRTTRRFVAYVRTLPGQDPQPLFAELEAAAAQRGWQVGHRLHDDGGPQSPQQSPEWLRARKLMHEGFADGVLVKDRSHISRDDDEYKNELEFVAERQCITALVVPEAAT